MQGNRWNLEQNFTCLKTYQELNQQRGWNMLLCDGQFSFCGNCYIFIVANNGYAIRKRTQDTIQNISNGTGKTRRRIFTSFEFSCFQMSSTNVYHYKVQKVSCQSKNLILSAIYFFHLLRGQMFQFCFEKGFSTIYTACFPQVWGKCLRSHFLMFVLRQV